MLPIHSNIVWGCDVHAVFTLRLCDIIGSVLSHVICFSLFTWSLYHFQVPRLEVSEFWNNNSIVGWFHNLLDWFISRDGPNNRYIFGIRYIRQVFLPIFFIQLSWQTSTYTAYLMISGNFNLWTLVTLLIARSWPYSISLTRSENNVGDNTERCGSQVLMSVLSEQLPLTTILMLLLDIKLATHLREHRTTVT